MYQSTVARWANRTLIMGVIAALAAVLVIGLSPTTVQAQSGCAAWHTVQVGENLFRIGLRYGVPFTVIASANGIGNPHRIFAGQRICIPGYSGVTSPASVAPSAAPASASPAVLVIPPFMDVLPDLPFYYPLNEPVTGRLGHQVTYWPTYGGRWNRDSIRLEPAINIWTPCEPEAVLREQKLVCSKTGLGWFYDFKLS